MAAPRRRGRRSRTAVLAAAGAAGALALAAGARCAQCARVPAAGRAAAKTSAMGFGAISGGLRAPGGATAPPQVAVSAGNIQGSWEKGGAVAAFRGVPYAGPVSGGLRWTPPQPAQPWEGLLDATHFGPGCAQSVDPSQDPDVPLSQSEDCLFVNVFTPADALSGGQLPIMIYIHGGAFLTGSSQGAFDAYDGGQMAASQHVIVASCNYRLGVLGFLAFPDAGLDGNYGIKDQRACIEWVRENAMSFGGDVGRVTIWGESAGAQSVLIHTVSPASAGLFQRAIVESSPALTLMNAEDAGGNGKAVAKQLNCNKGAASDIAHCIRGAALNDIFKASSDVATSWMDITRALSLKTPTASFLPFKPVVDGPGGDIPVQPISALLNGTAKGVVPTLIGTNANEFWAFLKPGVLPKILHGLTVRAVFDILFGVKSGNDVFDWYNTGEAEGNETAIADNAVTEYMFRCASEAIALQLPEAFVYAYDHLASFGPSVWPKLHLGQCAHKVCHEAELPMVFGNTLINETWSDVELAISANMQRAWASFATSGDPGEGWAPFESSQREKMIIKDDLVLKTTVDGSPCVALFDKTGYFH